MWSHDGRNKMSPGRGILNTICIITKCRLPFFGCCIGGWTWIPGKPWGIASEGWIIGGTGGASANSWCGRSVCVNGFCAANNLSENEH